MRPAVYGYGHAGSQPGALQRAMDRAGMSHGQRVRADIRGVRVRPVSRNDIGAPPGIMAIYFCDMEPLQITEVLEFGDGGPLPGMVEIENLEIPGVGEWNLIDVVLGSNGRMQVKMDAQSHCVLVAP